MQEESLPVMLSSNAITPRTCKKPNVIGLRSGEYQISESEYDKVEQAMFSGVTDEHMVREYGLEEIGPSLESQSF